MTFVEGRDIVLRIGHGEWSVAFFDRLFMWLRQHPTKRKSVRDVADFVAHSDNRDRGLAWDFAGALYDSIKYHSEMQSDVPVLKKTAIAHLRAVQMLEPAELATDRLGLSQEEAHLTLTDIINRFVDVKDNNWKFRPKLNEHEERVWRHYMQVFAWQPAFTEDSLMEDLIYVLYDLGALKGTEVEGFRKSGRYLCKFVIMRMHLSVMKLGDERPDIRLYASLLIGDAPMRLPYLRISAVIPDPINDQEVTHLVPVFEGHCLAVPPDVSTDIRLWLDTTPPPILGRPLRIDERGVLNLIYEEMS